MRRTLQLLLILSTVFGSLSFLGAQEQPSQEMGPPKVLVIFREFLKPGKSGAVHERSERAFVQAMTRANWPTHYFAVDSLSGRPRSLFLTGYDSFEAWEKDTAAMDKNLTLAPSWAKAMEADGDLLSDADQSVLTYSPEYSLRPPADIAHMRYFEISVFEVRPGHRKEWDELVKMVIAAYQKVPDAHWVTFERVYGQPGGGDYIVFTPLKSASEIDQGFDRDKQFAAAMGEAGMKRLGELEASAIASRQSNLFHFNPKMSYPPEQWVKADPEFWKPKGEMPSQSKKSTKKPVADQ